MGRHSPDFFEPSRFVCHTTSRCEKKFSELLLREKFAHENARAAERPVALHGAHRDDPANPQGIVVSVDVLQQGLLVRLPLENLELLP